MLTRRSVFGGIAPLGLLLGGFGRALAAPGIETGGLRFGPARPFSFDWLKDRARALSQFAFVPVPRPAPELVQSITYDLTWKIKFKPDYALWHDAPGRLPVSFFHLNRFISQPVKIHAVDGKQAREIIYQSLYFDYDGTDLGSRLPTDLGFSGFRAMRDRTNIDGDWFAFQGASYFRAAGSDGQYGASARGIAIDCGLDHEEFPLFTNFWIAEPPDSRATITIYALLEGPSLTGAYQFDVTREKGAVFDTHAELFMRAGVRRLGVAPLTSMYWYSETNRAAGWDWRPEIHDSDGLALWTGTGERIWRPLNDPKSVMTNSFLDTNPKGFGLMQRDRNFDHYQDDGAFYNRRPSMWVEPRGNWGEGSVQLVELPTDDEIHDNIVAYWLPKESPPKGTSVSYDYKLYFQDPEPHPGSLAHVIATRIGRGGTPGGTAPANTVKFVIDFKGGPIENLGKRYDLKPVVTLSRGRVMESSLEPVVGAGVWRAAFDVLLESADPIDMRCHLRVGAQELSETWLYQYFPTSYVGGLANR